MRYYAVIDTNVLVSALLKWNSVPGKVLQLVFSGVATPVLSSEILAEYREVLSRSKFHFTEDIVNTITDTLVEQGIFFPGENRDYLLPDAKDVVFYAVTMEARAEQDTYLVTGNIRHFPTEPFVVTPRQFLDLLLGSET